MRYGSQGVESAMQHVERDCMTLRKLLCMLLVVYISDWSLKRRAAKYRRRLGGCTAPRRRLHSRPLQDVAHVPGREL